MSYDSAMPTIRMLARDCQPWTGAHAVIDTVRRPVEASVIELHAPLLARERALR